MVLRDCAPARRPSSCAVCRLASGSTRKHIATTSMASTTPHTAVPDKCLGICVPQLASFNSGVGDVLQQLHFGDPGFYGTCPAAAAILRSALKPIVDAWSAQSSDATSPAADGDARVKMRQNAMHFVHQAPGDQVWPAQSCIHSSPPVRARNASPLPAPVSHKSNHSASI
jgi:hypothetical protein